MSRARVLSLLMSCVLTHLANAVPAAAQTDSPWEIEVHGGGLFPSHQTSGTTALPGAGASFPTSGIYGPPAPPVLVTASSRRVSSWYFGDGAVLFDQAATAVAANPVAMTAPFSARIVPLDRLLGRRFATAEPGGITGLRVSRVLTRLLTVEVSADYSATPVELSSADLAAIEATRQSFVSAFTGLIASNTGRSLRSVTSVANVERGRARHLFTSGALLVNLGTVRRLTPFARIGAGLMSSVGRAATVNLTGNYEFSNATNAIFNETDNVTISGTGGRHAFAGVFGGGVKYRRSRRWGLRFDAQVLLSPNTARTTLNADPQVAVGQQPAGRVTLNADPTVQFGNSLNPVTALGVTAVTPSSLSGPAINGLHTWSGTGMTTHMHVTLGVFWNF